MAGFFMAGIRLKMSKTVAANAFFPFNLVFISANAASQ